MSCVVRYRSLRRADHSSRGVLPSVMCDLGSSWIRRPWPWPTRGCRAKNKQRRNKIKKGGNYGSPCGMVFLQNFIRISWFVPRYWGKYGRRNNDTLNLLSAFVSSIKKMWGKNEYIHIRLKRNFSRQVVSCRLLRHEKNRSKLQPDKYWFYAGRTVGNKIP
jgi:hypothetical protein